MESNSGAPEPSGEHVGDVQPRRRLDDDGSVLDRPASTLMVVIDGFDSVAPTKRHRKVLDQVSWVITDTLRSTDALYRHGEAGFCVVMAQTPEHEALGAANRLCANVEAMPLLADAGVTVTVGVAVGSEADLDDSIARAGQAVSNSEEPNRVIRADDRSN